MIAKHVILMSILLLLNLKQRTWREIPSNKESLLYVMFINSFYYYLCKRHLLWEFKKKGVHWRVLRASHIYLVTPALVLLSLSSFPKSFIWQVAHLIKFVSASTLVEYYALKLKMLKFKHGWNIYWSGLLYLKMYLYSYLLKRNPVIVILLTIFSLGYFTYKFRIPMTRRFLKGPYFYLLKMLE